MESFWRTLKYEKNYYLNRYETLDEQEKAIKEYIQFYNHERYQERLNGLSPAEFRAKALKSFLLSPLPTWQGAVQMRNSGGIYFIPSNLSKATWNLVRLINSLEGSKAYLVPISNKDKNTNMDAQRLSKYVNGLLDQAEDVSDLR